MLMQTEEMALILKLEETWQQMMKIVRISMQLGVWGFGLDEKPQFLEEMTWSPQVHPHGPGRLVRMRDTGRRASAVCGLGRLDGRGPGPSHFLASSVQLSFQKRFAVPVPVQGRLQVHPQ